jgi:hypothetical protein
VRRQSAGDLPGVPAPRAARSAASASVRARPHRLKAQAAGSPSRLSPGNASPLRGSACRAVPPPSAQRSVTGLRPVRLAYQPPASSTFLSEQTSHQQPASSTFFSEQISTSHQPPANRTGCSCACKSRWPPYRGIEARRPVAAPCL